MATKKEQIAALKDIMDKTGTLKKPVKKVTPKVVDKPKEPVIKEVKPVEKQAEVVVNTVNIESEKLFLLIKEGSDYILTGLEVPGAGVIIKLEGKGDTIIQYLEGLKIIKGQLSKI